MNKGFVNINYKGIQNFKETNILKIRLIYWFLLIERKLKNLCNYKHQ